MPTACNYSWSDDLDAIIREEAAVAEAPLDLAYTFIAFESGFNVLARNLNPPIEDSVGLLQLNRIGGQGVGYTVAQLQDPRLNLRVGLPPIARAYAAAWQPTLAPFELLYRIATTSGHPGRIPRNDPRIRRAFNIWACFNSAVGFAGPGGAPAPTFVPGAGQAFTGAAAALFAPGMPIPPASILAGHAGSIHIPLLVAARAMVMRQAVYNLGPRTVLRRQLRALSPAGLRYRLISSIDPRQRFARAFRLPMHLAAMRLPPRHKLPRF